MLIPPKETPKVAPKFKVPPSSNAPAPVQHTEVESNATPTVSEDSLSVVTNFAPPHTFASNAEAAKYWFDFGLAILPIVSHSKLPALTWDTWLNDLSVARINQHWLKIPDHDVGFIVGDDFIVFDADSAESIAALVALEKAYDVVPNMVSKTTKGEHHFYRRAAGTFAKSDSHSTKEYPDRLDVKTGRAVIILPPSTGKTLIKCDAKNASELVEVGQAFIDAVFQHNGRPAPRKVEITVPASDDSASSGEDIGKLKLLLQHINPGTGREDWIHVLMAIFHTTSGSEEGFNLANSWSSAGASYPGEKGIRVQWNSFKSGTANPITIATLFKMARDNGADLSSINVSSGEQFEKCETEVVHRNAKANLSVVVDQPSAENTITVDADKQLAVVNPLDQYSLRGKSAELEKQALDEVFVLWDMALLGQLTVFYAWPNTGKTLLILHMLIDSIKCGRIDPAKLYYLNMDDSHKGLIEKLRLAEKHGFNMLADGYEDFSTGKFVAIMLEMIESDTAYGVIIVLDTLKKFTDVMDKKLSSNFAKVLRKFSLKGGTVIALAHANKKANAEGKPIPGGTSDIKDDIDCAYVMWAIPAEHGTNKVIQFEKSKSRGSVVESAAYSYSTERGISYGELLASVQPVDDTQLELVKQAEATKSDAEVITSITACITEGVNSKMKIAEAVRERIGISRNASIQVIERYEGNDPSIHRWTSCKGARGALIYSLLDTSQPVVDMELVDGALGLPATSDTTPDAEFSFDDPVVAEPDATADTTPDSSEEASAPVPQHARTPSPPVKVGGVWCAAPSGHRVPPPATGSSDAPAEGS